MLGSTASQGRQRRCPLLIVIWFASTLMVLFGSALLAVVAAFRALTGKEPKWSSALTRASRSTTES